MEVILIDTGVANIASIEAAFAREGVRTRYAKRADDIDSADAVLLPGVGTFASGMTSIRSYGFEEALRNRADAGKATLGICLGMQLFCSESEESPGVTGLGVIPVKLKRFPPSVMAPQFGWNTVFLDRNKDLQRDAYFANSFCLTDTPVGWSIYRAEYGVSFVAAAKKEKVLLTQFHPELSGTFGRSILQEWLAEAAC